MPKKSPLKFDTLKDALHYCELHDGNQVVAWSQAFHPSLEKEFWTVHMRKLVPLGMGKVKWSVVTGGMS